MKASDAIGIVVLGAGALALYEAYRMIKAAEGAASGAAGFLGSVGNGISSATTGFFDALANFFQGGPAYPGATSPPLNADGTPILFPYTTQLNPDGSTTLIPAAGTVFDDASLGSIEQPLPVGAGDYFGGYQ